MSMMPTTWKPRPSRAVAAGILLALSTVIGGCVTTLQGPGTGGPGAVPSAGASIAASPSPAPSTAAVPSPAASPTPSTTPKVTQTDTAWGRIWDAVPASFPIPAGAEPVSPDRAASGAWSISGGDPAAITEQLKSGLEAIGLTTASVDGPLEGGTRIIDSVGKPDTCHVQTRVAPMGTTVTITVLFGAACPFK